MCWYRAVEGQEAVAEAKTGGGKNTKQTLEKSFVTQAIAIVKTKKWQVYQGHVSTQVALGGSNFVYFFW